MDDRGDKTCIVTGGNTRDAGDQERLWTLSEKFITAGNPGVA